MLISLLYLRMLICMQIAPKIRLVTSTFARAATTEKCSVFVKEYNTIGGPVSTTLTGSIPTHALQLEVVYQAVQHGISKGDISRLVGMLPNRGCPTCMRAGGRGDVLHSGFYCKNHKSDSKGLVADVWAWLCSHLDDRCYEAKAKGV